MNEAMNYDGSPEDFKTVKWFRDGEPIPAKAVYLRSQTFLAGYHEPEHSLLNPTPYYEVGHLYELPYVASADSDLTKGDKS